MVASDVRGVMQLEEISKKGNRLVVHRLLSHLVSQARFRLSLSYLTSSSSMSTFQNTEYMDARGATFNNVGRDQVIINPMSLGAMQNHSCTIICSLSVIIDSRSQGTAKPSTRRSV
jgi:hypothetical protein